MDLNSKGGRILGKRNHQGEKMEKRKLQQRGEGKDWTEKVLEKTLSKANEVFFYPLCGSSSRTGGQQGQKSPMN